MNAQMRAMIDELTDRDIESGGLDVLAGELARAGLEKEELDSFFNEIVEDAKMSGNQVELLRELLHVECLLRSLDKKKGFSR